MLHLTGVALAAGLLVTAAQDDEHAAAVAAGTEAIVERLVDAGPELLAGEGDEVLRDAVVLQGVVLGARVRTATGGVVAEAGAWSVADEVRPAVTFARSGDEDLLLEVGVEAPERVMDTRLALLLWAVVAAGVFGIGLRMDRGRRRRLDQLEKTVRALSARDARMAAMEQDLLESKTGFVRAVSHELRTPLHVIRGVAQLLATRGDAVPDERRRELLLRMVANTERLDGLLEDLIDVDRLTSRTARVARREVDVHASVEAALAGVDTSGHEVVVRVDDVRAHATPAHVERILHHLLHNAVKYAPVATTITVEAIREGGRVELLVADEGPGVPAARRRSVFEPLHRTSDDGPQPGLGLGLALVRRLAELHGGRAWVTEAASGGAAFHVVLPDEGSPVEIDDWDLATHASA